MTKQEKKQLRELVDKIEDIQANISVMVIQEQTRLDSIGDGLSQMDRATKLEENIDSLEDAEEMLGDVITTLEEIL